VTPVGFTELVDSIAFAAEQTADLDGRIVSIDGGVFDLNFSVQDVGLGVGTFLARNIIDDMEPCQPQRQSFRQGVLLSHGNLLR